MVLEGRGVWWCVRHAQRGESAGNSRGTGSPEARRRPAEMGAGVRTTWKGDLRLHLLGDWLLTAGNCETGATEQIELPSGPQHLIAFLALNGPCAPTHASATLWPDRTRQGARRPLRAWLVKPGPRQSRVPAVLTIHD